jgi:excisionase family DNA binding protein
MDALLAVEEVARRLGGLSKWTVYAWLSQGKLNRTKVGGRTMVPESELRRVISDSIAAQASTPTDQQVKEMPVIRRREGDQRISSAALARAYRKPF